MKKISTLAVLLFFVNSVFAQKSAVESVVLEVQNKTDEEIDWDYCMSKLEQAKTNSKTIGYPKNWLYQAYINYKIYEITRVKKIKPELIEKYPNIVADAADAIIKLYETDAKGNYVNEQFAKSITDVAAQLIYNDGLMAYRIKDYSKALVSLNKALEISRLKDLSKVELSTNVIKHQISAIQIANNQPNEAIKIIDELIKDAYPDVSIYTSASNLQIEHFKDTVKALEYIEKGKEIDPYNGTLVNNEAAIYLALGKMEELIQKMDEAIAIDPANKTFYYAKGIAYNKQNKLDLAAETYQKALEIDPFYYDVQYNLGAVYIAKSNQYADAYDKAPNQLEADKILSSIKVEQQNAISWFEKALENPEVTPAQKYEAAKTLKEIYGKLSMMEKYSEMKNLMQEISEKYGE